MNTSSPFHIVEEGEGERERERESINEELFLQFQRDEEIIFYRLLNKHSPNDELIIVSSSQYFFPCWSQQYCMFVLCDIRARSVYQRRVLGNDPV